MLITDQVQKLMQGGEYETKLNECDRRLENLIKQERAQSVKFDVKGDAASQKSVRSMRSSKS